MEKGGTLRGPLRIEPTKENNTAPAQENNQLQLRSVAQLQLVTSVKKRVRGILSIALDVFEPRLYLLQTAG